MNLFQKIILYLIIVVIFINTIVATPNSCNLPNECQIIKPYEINDKFPYTIKCSLSSPEFDMMPTNISDDMEKCEIYSQDLFVIFFYTQLYNPFSSYILDRNFKFDNFYNYMGYFGIKKLYEVGFHDVQGFQMNLTEITPQNSDQLDYIKGTELKVQFYKSKFDFFIGNKRVESCEDLLDSNLTWPESSLFQTFQITKYSVITFKKCEFKRKICPYIFNNARFYGLEIYNLINTFLKTNVLRFIDLNGTKKMLFQSNINYLKFFKLENIELNNEILDKYVFQQSLGVLTMEGNHFWIHPRVFRSFEKLKTIAIYFEEQKLLKSLGIEWMHTLNSNVNVSLNEIELMKRSQFIMIPRSVQIFYHCLENIKAKDLFPDEDFCLYANMPFRQLVFIKEGAFIRNLFLYYSNNNESFYEDISCTFLWLIQYYPVYIRYFKITFNLKHFSGIKVDDIILEYMGGNDSVKVEKCNFQKRLNNCISKNRAPKNAPSFSDVDNAISLSYAQMVFTFLIPIVCAIGIVNNILVIRTIPFIKKDPELKDRRHYDYMRINSVVNCGIFLIKITGLINECTAEFWCSQIHLIVAIQYYKLIFVEFLGTSLRFFSNFTYMAFQLCRLALIGKEHGWLVVKVSEKISIKRFVSYYACLSLILSVVKYFRYQINDNNLFGAKKLGSAEMETIDKYPVKLSIIDNLSFDEFGKSVLDFQSDLNTRSEIWAFIIINCLSDVLNYPLFLVICLVLDIVTARELRITLSQKMVSSNKQAEEEKEQAIFKSNLLVIINMASNFLLKLPMTINSIFEIIISLNYKSNTMSYQLFNYFIYFIVDLNGGDFFENLANFLYFLSLALYFVFYYNFDRMFKFYFRKWFFKDKSNPNQGQVGKSRPNT